MTGCGADRAAADRPRGCAGPLAPPPSVCTAAWNTRGVRV